MASGAKEPRVVVTFPSGGIVDTVARTQQPFPTSTLGSNVMPFSLNKRNQGGSRPGSSLVWHSGSGGIGGTGKFLSAPYDATHFIQHFETYPWLDGSNASTIYFVIVAEGVIYCGTMASPPVASTNTSTGTNFSAARRVEGTLSRGIIYMTDGLTYKKLNPITNTVTDWVEATTGRLTNMRLLTTWFDCVMLAQKTGSPHLWQTTRGGDGTDFDTGGTVTPDMPVTANVNWKAGQIGQAINALIPGIGNDLIFGLDHGLYRMVGHPADGGIMQVISDSVGVLTPDSWDTADRLVYWIGPMGFHVFDGASLQNLSMNKYDNAFTNLPAVGWHVNTVYDRVRHGIWVFITNATTPSQQKSFWYDLRTGGFFPFTFNNSQTCATRALFYDGNSNTFDSQVLWAGTDGYIHKWDETVAHDETVDGINEIIFSSITIGPFLPGKDVFGQYAVRGIWTTLGDTPSGYSDSDVSVDFQLLFGDDPASALNGLGRSYTGTWSGPGRQANIGLRQSFGAMYVVLSNSTINKCWSFEQIVMPVIFQGRLLG
jgi:hypothetical protein